MFSTTIEDMLATGANSTIKTDMGLEQMRNRRLKKSFGQPGEKQANRADYLLSLVTCKLRKRASQALLGSAQQSMKGDG